MTRRLGTLVVLLASLACSSDGPGGLGDNNLNTWSASSAQGSGSIVVTTLTPTRVVGTFSFVLQPDVATGASGTRTVTEGRFDLTY